VIVKEPIIFKQFDTLTECVCFFIFPTRISVNEPKFWMISWWLDRYLGLLPAHQL